MALNKSSLQSSILTWLQSTKESRSEAAQALSDAYTSYAAGAQSCGAPGIPAALTGGPALTTGLTSAFSTSDPASGASGMATAFTAFWMVPPVVFTGVTPGAVTLVGGTAVLQAGLVSTWAARMAAGGATAAEAAEDLANLLDAFTKTVVVTHSAPVACVSTLM